MLMLCWFYCIPFAKLLYYALGFIVFIFSLFMLKRGLRMGRKRLRGFAFGLMFISAVKLCIFDVWMGREALLCGREPYIPWLPCNAWGFQIVVVAGIVVLAAISFLLFIFYTKYSGNLRPRVLSPKDVNLRFWANTSQLFVFAMMVWTLAPWIGFLTVGSVPKMFSVLQWQHFAIANVVLLLVGFWKVESCSWEYVSKGSKDQNGDKKTKSAYVTGGWTPKDTLWLNTFLYLITLALSYVAHDVLTGSYQAVNKSGAVY